MYVTVTVNEGHEKHGSAWGYISRNYRLAIRVTSVEFQLNSDWRVLFRDGLKGMKRATV